MRGSSRAALLASLLAVPLAAAGAAAPASGDRAAYASMLARQTHPFRRPRVDDGTGGRFVGPTPNPRRRARRRLAALVTAVLREPASARTLRRLTRDLRRQVIRASQDRASRFLRLAMQHAQAPLFTSSKGTT